MPSGRIILAEDDAASRTVFAEVLRGAGYEVIATESGEEALEQVSQSQPSVLLLDIQLPGLDGRECCRRARAMRGPDMPILFVTVSDTLDMLDACLKAGGNDFLIKTERPQDILSRVNMWQSPRLRQGMETRRIRALARVDKAIKTGAGLADTLGSVREAITGPASVGDLDAWLDGQDDRPFDDGGSLDFDDFNPMEAFGEPGTKAPSPAFDPEPVLDDDGDLEELPWEPRGNGKDPAPAKPAAPAHEPEPNFEPDIDLADSFFDALDGADQGRRHGAKPEPIKPARKPKKPPAASDMAEQTPDDFNELRWD